LQAGNLKLLDKTRFLATPRPGVRTNARTYYAEHQGRQLISIHTLLSRSDTMDTAFRRISPDNGDTWGPPTTVPTYRATPQGVRRIYPRTGYADPTHQVLIEFRLEGTLPGDDPLEGMKHWSLFYRLSRDGGRTFYHDGPVVDARAGFSAAHPFAGVRIGSNSMMIGDQSCAPITLASGELLQPVQITPVGPDGKYHNPGGGYTYHDAAVLIGHWNASERFDWSLSARVEGDPARSTRGMIEPTVVELPDRKILMVMRGSNDRRPALPGYKWYSISGDRGRTWTAPVPWGFSDGEAFFSPSSCSQLLAHSSGRILWIGNITAENPRGNLPRYPLVIGEVDPGSRRLIRASLCTIDGRRDGDEQPGPDSPDLMLSNFFAREDRATGDVLVHCSPVNRTRIGAGAGSGDDREGASEMDWTADAWLYRIGVDPAG
jgi:hypothetical protein